MESQARRSPHPPRVVDSDPVRGGRGVRVCDSALFAGTFTSYVPVTLTSDRSGLVMETNAKVKMRGVQVGRVSQINSWQRTR